MKVTLLSDVPKHGGMIHCECEHGACELNAVHTPGRCHAHADGKYSLDGFQNFWLCEYCVKVYSVEEA